MCKPVPIFDTSKNIPLHFIKRLDMYYIKEFNNDNSYLKLLLWEFKLDIDKLRKDIEEFKKSEQEKLELNNKLLEANQQILKLKSELKTKTKELDAYSISIDL
jgi:predicted RNase H-like nuclease (RuvC/YqgF family)